MNTILSILFLWMIPFLVSAQAKDSLYNKAPPKPPRAEILTNGFIDIMNSGQMNASARLFRLYIGEPQKFQLPVSLYTGVSANNINPAPQRINEPAALNLIHPLSGIINISADGLHFFGKNRTKNLTRLGFQYQAGQKALSNVVQPSLKNITWFSSFGNAGLLFQTGAWEKQDEKNMGIFWVLGRYMLMRPDKMADIVFPDAGTGRRWLNGYSLGCGIEINNVLNIKAFYYRYLRVQADPFATGIWHFSFNYSMRQP